MYTQREIRLETRVNIGPNETRMNRATMRLQADNGLKITGDPSHDSTERILES